MAQPKGLSLLLDGEEQGVFGSCLGAAAAASAAAVAGPLLYHSNGRLAIASAIAGAAVPLVYSLRPSAFTVHADAAALHTGDVSPPSEKVLPELKPVLGLYHPFHLGWMLAKNLGMQLAISFNKYLQVMLEHEKHAIIAEENGEPVPEPPPMPDIQPVVHRGLTSFGRELAVSTTRRIYEHAAVWRLGSRRAGALLRDSKCYIRDVLVSKHANDAARRRFTAYQFAVLHANVLLYAADCTVAVAQHGYRAVRRKDKSPAQRLLWFLKGVALHVARCTAALLGVSVVAALGGVKGGGRGAWYGHVLSEVAFGMGLSIPVGILLSD